MKKSLILFFIIIFTSQVSAQVIYVSSANDELYRLDINNCVYEFVSDIQSQMYDISFHPNGNLYGISGHGNFYEIDTIDGTTNFIHDFDWQNFNSLTIDWNGLVYTTGNFGQLWSYDILSGDEIYHGDIGYAATGDLTFFEGNLYAAVTLDRIVLIDIDEPSNSIVIIDENVFGDVLGIVSFAADCNDITVYALVDNFTNIYQNTDIYQIDFTTNSFLHVCELDFRVYGGASTFEFFASSPIVIQDFYEINPNCDSDNGVISIEATGGIGQISYSLDGTNFQSSGLFINLSSRFYTVIISDENDCIISQEFELLDFSPQITTISTIKATCDNADGSIFISVTGGTGQIQVSLNGGNYQSSFFIDNLHSGQYHAILMDEIGCEIDTILTINQEKCPMFIPNAFSPNDDGFNDVFKIYLHPDFKGTFRTFRVYDRWGTIIYESLNFNPESDGWNGTFNGEKVGIGVYVYLLELILENGKEEFLSGNIDVIK